MKYRAVWRISGTSASRDITMVLGSIHIPQHGIVLEIASSISHVAVGLLRMISQ
jgi:hypothetical protein